MAGNATLAPEVLLRPVEDADLDVLFEHQADPAAVEMAAFPARDRAAFDAHWARVRVDETVVVRTILAGGAVAGHIASWPDGGRPDGGQPDGGRRLLGYGIGRAYWGRGIATRALALFLGEVPDRPLYAHVAVHNAASARVLRKCGFRSDGAREAPDGVQELIFVFESTAHPLTTIRRLFELLEPVATVTFSEVPNEAFLAVGMRNYWDGYFAGRAAPLGQVPAEVVHAVFYNFADGEVARHIPWVWGKVSPREAIAIRERGSADALRQMIGAHADAPGLARIADLATRAGLSAPTEGRPLYAGLRTLDVPADPVARLWHAATLLREHRGDGHNAVLLAHGVGGTEAHVLLAVSLGMRAAEFGRLHHLPAARLAAVVDGLRRRGLIDADGGFTDAGRELKQRIEDRTDELAAPAYDVLTAAEMAELVAGLEPIAAAIADADS